MVTGLVNDYGALSVKFWATLPTCCNFSLLPLLSIYHYVTYFHNTVSASFSHLWFWWKQYPGKSIDVMTRQLNACVCDVYL